MLKKGCNERQGAQIPPLGYLGQSNGLEGAPPRPGKKKKKKNRQKVGQGQEPLNSKGNSQHSQKDPKSKKKEGKI